MPKTRKTTSVSTLVNDIDEIILNGAARNVDRSIMLVLAQLHNDIGTLEKAYNTLRRDCDTWKVKLGLVSSNQSVTDILASFAPAETEDETEEVEA